MFNIHILIDDLKLYKTQLKLNLCSYKKKIMTLNGITHVGGRQRSYHSFGILLGHPKSRRCPYEI